MQYAVGEQKITLKKVTKGWRGETAGSGCFTAVELSRGHKAEATGSKTMRGDDVDRVRFFLSRGRVTFVECLLAKARLSRALRQKRGERERGKGEADTRPWNIDEGSVNQWSRSKYRKKEHERVFTLLRPESQQRIISIQPFFISRILSL